MIKIVLLFRITTIVKLIATKKSNLKKSRDFYSCFHISPNVWLHYMNSDQMLSEKELHKDAACRLEYILEVAYNKIATE